MLVLLLKWPSIIKTSTIFFMRRYEVYKTWYKSSCFLEFSYSHLTMCCLLECGGHSLLVVVCEVSWYCLLYFNIPKGLPLGPGDYLTALHAHLHHLLHQGVWTLDSTMQFFLSPDTSSTVDLHCVSPRVSLASLTDPQINLLSEIYSRLQHKAGTFRRHYETQHCKGVAINTQCERAENRSSILAELFIRARGRRRTSLEQVSDDGKCFSEGEFMSK